MSFLTKLSETYIVNEHANELTLTCKGRISYIRRHTLVIKAKILGTLTSTWYSLLVSYYQHIYYQGNNLPGVLKLVFKAIHYL